MCSYITEVCIRPRVHYYYMTIRDAFTLSTCLQLWFYVCIYLHLETGFKVRQGIGWTLMDLDLIDWCEAVWFNCTSNQQRLLFLSANHQIICWISGLTVLSLCSRVFVFLTTTGTAAFLAYLGNTCPQYCLVREIWDLHLHDIVLALLPI